MLEIAHVSLQDLNPNSDAARDPLPCGGRESSTAALEDALEGVLKRLNLS
jgi:hypothetical protein